MIRTRKPVRLLEWGKGTNTTNQVWTVFGEGQIVQSRMRNGVTTLVIQTNGSVSKQNDEDKTVKLAQPGEGMTANSARWGEVAMGTVQSIQSNQVTVQIATATKIDTRKHD